MADPPNDSSPAPPSDSSHLAPALPDVQRALDEHYTLAVRETVQRFAEQRASLVRMAGRPVPKNYAKELAADAYSSIWLGLRRWDPDRIALDARLCWIIKDRTWWEIRQTKKREHVPFDLAVHDPALDLEAALSIDVAASAVDHTRFEIVGLTRQVIASLDELAEDDAVRAILRCWAQGFVEHDDIRALTGLSRPTFRAAYDRILRLAKRLPPELREAVLDLLNARRVS